MAVSQIVQPIVVLMAILVQMQMARRIDVMIPLVAR
jgi:hypothetical protein